MKYAASIGGLGLDKYKDYTRDEVYGMKSDIADINDYSIPPDYMPEDDCYRVVKIVILVIYAWLTL